MSRIDSHIPTAFRGAMLLLVTVLLGGCARCEGDVEGRVLDPDLLETHRVVYGGDVFLGRQLNTVLHDPKTRAAVFGNAAPLLSRADAALVNAEGVIAAGGRFTDKGELDPHMYRAHPNAVDVLANAGVDVVTVGNNHSGDYGRLAFREMLDRLVLRNIQYTGGGVDAADARRPAFVTMGDTVVAFVGADLTTVEQYAATPTLPGTLFFGHAHRGVRQDETVRALTKILRRAKQSAHVVLFTPHWGNNWQAAPTPHLRRLARRLIGAGFDAILGHSAHWFQGVEVIDGKPVIYDAGNLVLDYDAAGKAHQAFLWELEVTRAGVTGIHGFPLRLSRNHTDRASAPLAETMLRKLNALSTSLGTHLTLGQNAASLALPPSSTAISKIVPPPPRPKPKRVREAPSDAIIRALPKSATRVNVRYENGISLIGYELLRDAIALPRSAQLVLLYFKASKKIKRDYIIHLEARGLDPSSGEPKKQIAGHMGGDWVMPTDQWPVGKIVRDASLVRLMLKPEGNARFYAGLWDGRKMVVPAAADTPLTDGALVFLGETRHRKDAPGLSHALEAYQRRRQPDSRLEL